MTAYFNFMFELFKVEFCTAITLESECMVISACKHYTEAINLIKQWKGFLSSS